MMDDDRQSGFEVPEPAEAGPGGDGAKAPQPPVDLSAVQFPPEVPAPGPEAESPGSEMTAMELPASELPVAELPPAAPPTPQQSDAQNPPPAEQARPPERRGDAPSWNVFLMPGAIILGAVIIAGSILYTHGSTGPGSAAASASPAAAEAGASPGVPGITPGASPAGTPVPSVGEVFASYAAELGLDAAAFTTCVANPATAATVSEQEQRGLAAGVSGTPTFFINNKMVVGAQPAAIFDEVIAAELKGSPTTLVGYSAAIQQLAAASPPYFAIVTSVPDASGAPLEGSPSARVKIVELSDFQCPYCKRFFDTTLPEIRARLGTDVSLAYLQFPLSQLHPNAEAAAVAAACAGAQGKFWQMHDLLFQQQAQWSGLPPG